MDSEPVVYPTNYSVVWADEGEDRHLIKAPVPEHEPVKFPWVPDRGDGTYRNPIICADYSDPDACRVGDDFYMTASSFSCVPGLPILHSRDLVNWQIIGHAFEKYLSDFAIPRHGCGVWAPAIRFHAGRFYIFWGDPDNGIFMVRSKTENATTTTTRHPTEWEPVHRVCRSKGWIDTCPFWDEDGQAYLVHAFSRLRAGFRNVLHLHRMSADGRELLDGGKEIISGHGQYTVVEGPKLYKRNGFYYVFAPGGSVSQGYQIVFRAKDIFGPYESRIVLDRGSTSVNGPHQGAWVNTGMGAGGAGGRCEGEDWFVHFQELLPYGRLLHLQPMRWQDDWPVIGKETGNSERGEPVLEYRKPVVAAAAGAVQEPAVPQTSDEFDAPELGRQWQWWANYRREWFSLSARPGYLRLFPVSPAPFAPDELFYNRSNLLLQKFPAEIFTVTAKLGLSRLGKEESAGLVLAGKMMIALDCRLAVQPTKEEWEEVSDEPHADGAGGGGGGEKPAIVITRTDFRFGDPAFPADVPTAMATVQGTEIFLQLRVVAGGICTFFYSADGRHFKPLGNPVKAVNAMWIGAKVGLFAAIPSGVEATGFADVDWFRFSP